MLHIEDETEKELKWEKRMAIGSGIFIITFIVIVLIMLGVI